VFYREAERLVLLCVVEGRSGGVEQAELQFPNDRLALLGCFVGIEDRV
jgi:hypothetical protein